YNNSYKQWFNQARAEIDAQAALNSSLSAVPDDGTAISEASVIAGDAAGAAANGNDPAALRQAVFDSAHHQWLTADASDGIAGQAFFTPPAGRTLPTVLQVDGSGREVTFAIPNLFKHNGSALTTTITRIDPDTNRISFAQVPGLNTGETLVYSPTAGSPFTLNGLTAGAGYTVVVDPTDSASIFLVPLGSTGAQLDPDNAVTLSAGLSLHNGDAIVYHPTADYALTGLTPGATYYALLDPTDPASVALLPS